MDWTDPKPRGPHPNYSLLIVRRPSSIIGAVQKLLENNIEIISVSACSMGTALGALICSGMDLTQIEKSIPSFDHFDPAHKKIVLFFVIV
jgi:hypothetical protein